MRGSIIRRRGRLVAATTGDVTLGPVEQPDYRDDNGELVMSRQKSIQYLSSVVESDIALLVKLKYNRIKH